MAQLRTFASPEAERTPLTIVTGFLGAGKTTLLNHVLKACHPRRVAVVENEFGEVNVDSALVVDNVIAKEDVVNLDHGCVCCSLRKDLVIALAELEKRQVERNYRYEAVLLETTGLADPAPVAFTLFANPWLARKYRLDAIICVVDARYCLQHIQDERRCKDGAVNEAVQQIAFADLILVNKIDLVSEEELANVMNVITSINRVAKIEQVQMSDPDNLPRLDQLLNLHAFSVEKALQVDPQFFDEDDSEGIVEDETVEDGPSFTSTPPAASPAAATPAAAAAAAGDATGNGNACTNGAALRSSAVDNSIDTSLQPTTPPEPTGAEPADDAANSAASADFHDLNHSKSKLAAAKLASPSLTAVNLAHEPPCEHNCRECTDAAGAHDLVRQPKKKAKRLHDLSGVQSVGITAAGPLDKYRFNMFMRDLLAEHSVDIFRCKGVLCIHGHEEKRFVFQGVHETIKFGPAAEDWRPDETRVSKIVFIGRNLSRAALLASFRSCVWVALPEGWTDHLDPKSGRPYYVHTATGRKQWVRPAECCPRVVATVASVEQPTGLLPRLASVRRSSLNLAEVEVKAD